MTLVFRIGPGHGCLRYLLLSVSSVSNPHLYWPFPRCVMLESRFQCKFEHPRWRLKPWESTNIALLHKGLEHLVCTGPCYIQNSPLTVLRKLGARWYICLHQYVFTISQFIPRLISINNNRCTCICIPSYSYLLRVCTCSTSVNISWLGVSGSHSESFI